MHARRHQWTIFTLIATVTLVIGCRGARPLGNVVQITEEQGVDLPELEAPRQRLAVNKPRTESDSGVERTMPVADANPHVNRVVSEHLPNTMAPNTPAPTTTAPRTRPDSDTISIRLADHDTTGVDPPVVTAARKTASPSPPPSNRQTVTDSDDPIRKMSDQEMTAAFESQPEYVKRMAMRQLIASIKASAEKTAQPEAVDSAIANSVDDLPELPQSTGQEALVPATRIAAGESSERPTNSVAQATGVQADPGASDLATADRDDQDSITTVSDEQQSGLQRVVAESISDGAKQREIQPVSASQAADDLAMVKQAGVEPAVTAQADRLADVAATATTGKLTEQALYSELLQRLSIAPDGESEADRSSRLIKQRHLLVLSGNPDAAVEKIEEMSETEQEYMRHQLLGLWTMVDPNGHPIPSRRFTTALPQMREATKFAAAATDSLDVRSLAFCTGIESYGQIKTFPGNRFDAGQQVILYCEIENFSVAKTSEGFQTHLQGSYDIYNAENEKVVSQLLPADKQVSANFLRDYFIAYQMHLPQQLSAGTYRLQLTMEDVGSKKYGQSSIPFEIAK